MGERILLGVTGSVSASLVPKLMQRMLSMGHEICVIITEAAKQFVDFDALVQLSGSFNACKAVKVRRILDDQDEIDFYRKDKTVLHVELARWASRVIIAPCTSNTLNKINMGLADNLLLSTLKAVDRSMVPVFLAPAMNTQMFVNDYNAIFVAKGMGYDILWPTVKLLACGSHGIGAMADVDTICRIAVDGHRWRYPLKNGIGTFFPNRRINHPGLFGAVRKHDVHTGVDVYVYPHEGPRFDDHDVVVPVEDGVVMHIGQFTGKRVGSPWWLDSEFVAVRGRSGIVVYGEILVELNLRVGMFVEQDTRLGIVTSILRKDPVVSVYPHSQRMLHLELLRGDAACECAPEWPVGGARPKELLDPSVYMFDMWRN